MKLLKSMFSIIMISSCFIQLKMKYCLLYSSNTQTYLMVFRKSLLTEEDDFYKQ